MTAPAKRERAAQRPQRYHVIAVRADGRRTIMLSTVDRREIDAFVAKHRPFAVAAGGNLVVEGDEMRVVEMRR